MIDAVQGDRLASLIGLEDIGFEGDRAWARLPVTDKLRQPFGIVHGGIYPVVAETVCSAATYMAVAGDGMVAMGQANNASFLRPVSEGTIHAEARVIHRGRTTWVWDCDLRDDNERLCAVVRMTVAVRPAPS